MRGLRAQGGVEEGGGVRQCDCSVPCPANIGCVVSRAAASSGCTEWGKTGVSAQHHSVTAVPRPGACPHHHQPL